MDRHTVQLHVGSINPARLSVSGTENVSLRLGSSGGGGTNNYERLRNKPSIEEVELVGNRELGEFGMGLASEYDIVMLFH